MFFILTLYEYMDTVVSVVWEEAKFFDLTIIKVKNQVIGILSVLFNGFIPTDIKAWHGKSWINLCECMNKWPNEWDGVALKLWWIIEISISWARFSPRRLTSPLTSPYFGMHNYFKKGDLVLEDKGAHTQNLAKLIKFFFFFLISKHYFTVKEKSAFRLWTITLQFLNTSKWQAFFVVLFFIFWGNLKSLPRFIFWSAAEEAPQDSQIGRWNRASLSRVWESKLSNDK